MHSREGALAVGVEARRRVRGDHEGQYTGVKPGPVGGRQVTGQISAKGLLAERHPVDFGRRIVGPPGAQSPALTGRDLPAP